MGLITWLADALLPNVCMHDWEVLESKRVSRRGLYSEVLERRICLRCGEIDDQIARHESDLRQDEERRAARKRLAKQLAAQPRDELNESAEYAPPEQE